MVSLESLIKEGESFNPKTTSYQGGMISRHNSAGFFENERDVYQWIGVAKRYIATYYSNEDIAFEDFNSISKKDKITAADIYTLLGDLKGIREMPEKSLRPIETAPQIINNNILNANLIIDSIKSEIEEDKLREFKKIESNNSAEKRGKIINKLKTFGEDTLSKIIANIVTNPSIWSQL